MPYSGANDTGLPGNVKKLPTQLKKQWVAIFNSTYDACIAKGGKEKACETKAFTYANGVVKKEGRSMNLTFMEKLGDIVRSIFDPEEEETAEERAIALSGVFGLVDQQAYQDRSKYGWLVDIFRENDGTLAALFNSEGKLLKATVDFSDIGDIALGEPQEVQIELVPIRRSDSFTIIRETPEKVRWVSTSCTSIINRVSEIDSRDLFDDMIKRAEETDNYPYRTFFHQGPSFKTGQCDYLARDGNVLITSGLYDDSDLARAEVAARERDPDFWGESIRYFPSSDPEYIGAEGLRIPVYRSGVMDEVSTLPESDAASFFTNQTFLEVKRTMEKTSREYAALVKLFGTAEKADEWLTTHVDGTNRTIEESGAVSREAAPVAPPPVEEPVVTEPEVPAVEEEAVATEFVLDDPAVARIAEQVAVTEGVTSMLASFNVALAELHSAVAQLTSELANARAASIKGIQGLDSRIANLEKPVEETRQQWLQDVPRNINRTTVTYRPSDNAETQESEDDLAKIANATLAKLE